MALSHPGPARGDLSQNTPHAHAPAGRHGQGSFPSFPYEENIGGSAKFHRFERSFESGGFSPVAFATFRLKICTRANREILANNVCISVTKMRQRVFLNILFFLNFQDSFLANFAEAVREYLDLVFPNK